MHIAICDDNVADRKQMERLLARESDKRISTTGNLYIDSYGNADALLRASLTYDAYYIDMCHTEGMTGTDLVAALTAKGIHSPMFLCCSLINYRTLADTTSQENISCLDKPIQVPALSESIDQALGFKKQAPVMIELREEEHTIYVTEPEILYGIEDGFHVVVTLTEGRSVRLSTSALNFFSQVEHFPVFMAPTDKVVINCRYIAKLGFHKAVMADGTRFKIHRDCMPYAKQMFAQQNEKPN